jgi:hypothetical protein
MERSWGHRVLGTRRIWRVAGLLTVALALTACNPDNQGVSAQQPRGATVAFDSLDGLPPGQFQQLVKDLNDEAQSRRLAVISREQPSAYRVRGYLAATVVKHQTTVSWVWDVFDQDEHRALRISGEEVVKVRHKDAWAAADNAMLQRIAQSSMEQLATFLTSPAVAPGTAPSAEPQIALIGTSDSSPEAAGIFRIFHPQADPISTVSAEPPGEDETGPVPLPRRRPAALVSSRETLTLAAYRR